MSLEDALLQDIRANPADDAPRLVYADWLEEQGRPERAEFIRAQVECARMGEDDPRRAELQKRAAALEKAHAKKWLQPLRQALDRPGTRQLERAAFERGFVRKLTLGPRRADFLDGAVEALSREPVEELWLVGRPTCTADDALPALWGTPALACLGALVLYGDCRLKGDTLRQLGEAAHLGRLATLCLMSSLSADVLAALAGTPLADRLERLTLDLVRGSEPGLLALLTAPAFPRLATLCLVGAQLGDEGLGRLAQSPPPALTGLELSDPSVGPRGLAALIGSSRWLQLSYLGLSHAALGDEGARLLAPALAGGCLRWLRLEYARLTADAALALAEVPSWGSLETLSLRGNALGDVGVTTLAQSPRLAGLRRLSVPSCGLTEAGVRALVESPHAAGLREVQVYEPTLSQSARRALRKRFGKGFRFDP
jgi:uncharacterized protein (TIGR02996 family)